LEARKQFNPDEQLTSESDLPAQMSRPSYVIDIVSLSKEFRRRTHKQAGYTTIKTSILNCLFRRNNSEGHFTTAVKDLTLRIPRGASVGIIGSNGSGKSTLLKLITGIYRPSSGSVSVNGRIAALIELGAGFHPDFTGRENLFLGGAIHGLSRQAIEDKLDEIVRFAELENVIDDPVRTYSSGMFMRLGFSLAVHTDPDILIVDEVLAVGDAAFVSKCKERIALLKKEGKTLLLVTHDLDAVERWCDEALWLNNGVCCDRGDPRRVIDSYREYVEKGEESELLSREVVQSEKEEKEQENDQSETSFKDVEDLEATRWGSREIEITGASLKKEDGKSARVFHPNDRVVLEIEYQMHEELKDIVFGIGIERSDGVVVHGTNTDIEKIELENLPVTGRVSYELTRLGLLDGVYHLDVAVHKKDGYPYDYRKKLLQFAVRWPLKQAGIMLPEHKWNITGVSK